MCGIAGVIRSSGTVSESVLDALQNRLAHRGPNDRGCYLNASRSVGLVHTRLSILDLSPAGHQPMKTADGRYTIVFNGEIYNFRKLRSELENNGCSFHSDSDTEVLLQLYAHYGAAMLQRLEGMFAFAIWDEVEQTCFLSRDPLGIKPLYYSLEGGLAFASELRALLATHLCPRRIDPQSLAQYLLFGSVPEPGTIVDGVRALPAGHSLQWSAKGVSVTSYWEPSYSSEPIDYPTATMRTKAALRDSVERHLVSDVPVGVFLSGGLDSTSLLALATEISGQSLETFCISFDEAEFNEGEVAQRTAKHFNCRHHDWRLNAKEGRELIEKFLTTIDCPSNDGFNTYCVSQLASQSGLKVVLSGLGGDELFGSYPSFQKVPQLLAWHKTASMLGPCRKLIGQTLTKYRPGSNWARLGVYLQTKGKELAAYWAMRGFFTPSETDEIVRHYTGQSCQQACMQYLDQAIPAQPTTVDSVAYLETTRYMRNQLLRDSDVFSMAHGLELRVPLVDKTLFETVNKIPVKLRLKAGKQLLCDAVPEIPEWILNAPKRGFRFPFENWVKQEWNNELEAFDDVYSFPMTTWYRKWTLFTLEYFLQSNGLI